MTTNIHWFGDSISGGFALGTFTPSPTHPLYELRGPSSTLNYLFGINDLDWVSTHRARAIDGNTSPAAEEQALIQAVIDAGTIVTGDYVVIEDAGPHGSDPAGYQTTLTAVCERFLTQIVGITLLILTTPDYPPAAATDQYDRVINGMTTNDARRAVVQAYAVPGATPSGSSVVLLDWNAEADALRAEMLQQDSVQQYVDGVHPEVWGQMVLCRLVAQGCGLASRIVYLDPLQDLCAANYTYLQYGSTSLDAARARYWVLRMIGEYPTVAKRSRLVGSIHHTVGSVDGGLGALYGTLATLAPQYPVVLGNQGLVIPRGGWARSLANQFAAPLRTGAITSNNRTGEQIVTLDSWFGGEGFNIFEPETPDRYYQGAGIDPQTEEGALSLGPHMATAQATSFDELTVARVFGGKLYVGTSSGGIYTWNGASWALFQSWGKAGGVRAMECFADSIYFGNGSDGDIARYDGTTWTAPYATVTGFGGATVNGIRALALHYQEGVPKLYYAATTTLYGQVASVSSSGTLSGGDDFGTLEPRIDVLIPYKHKLVVVASNNTDKYWSLFEGDDTATIGWEFRYGRVENSMIRCAAVLDDNLYLGDAVDGRIWRWDGTDLTVVRQLGSDLDPYTKSGANVEIRGMTTYRGKLYISIVDSDDTLGLLVYDGNQTWHRPVTGLSGTTPTGLAQFSGQLYYLTQASGASGLYNTNGTFRASGSVQSGLIDASLSGTQKQWRGVTVTHTVLVSGQSVQIQYQLEGAGAWTTLGTSSTVGATTASYDFPGNVSADLIAFKINLAGSAGSSSSLKVFALSARYLPNPSAKREWSLKINLRGTTRQANDSSYPDHPHLMDGVTREPLTGEEIGDEIRALIDANEPCLFTDLDRQEQYTVKIAGYNENLPSEHAGVDALGVGVALDADLRLQEV